MNPSQYSSLFSFLFNIANDVLVQAFEKGDYKKIILPFIVLRRLDLLLEPTKEAALRFSKSEAFALMPEESREQQLCLITGYPFYNTSPFTMNLLRAETDSTRLRQNFYTYLDGFSKHVQDIIANFDLRHYVERLSSVGRLGLLIEKMTDKNINLGSVPVMESVSDPETGEEKRVEKLPALDNHTMGTLFEELLRKFNEDYSVTEAGEHYTPRDYVSLLADLAILPVADRMRNQRYSIYDGACGTGGILSLAQDRIRQLAEQHHKRWTTELYGQELQPETFATCKADLMLSGHSTSFTYRQGGISRDRFINGSTISQDGHPGKKFHFCISNPPFGTPWKADLENWGISDKKKITDPRFFHAITEDGREKVLSFVPGIGDPQMLFLANNVSRMLDDDEQGTRIVEIHNGSSLFTGNADGGESNLRRYIIGNDMLEAVIAMPENMFYNTGIGTFVWIVTNRKEPRRRGKVQLIDATAIKTPLRKNLGNKNCEVNAADRQAIVKLLMDFEENEQSRIFDNREFGYWQISVERPLRQSITLNKETLSAFALWALKKDISFDKDALHALSQFGIDGSKTENIPVVSSLFDMMDANLKGARKVKFPKTIGQVRADIATSYIVDILCGFALKQEKYLDLNKFAEAFDAHPKAKSFKIKFDNIKSVLWNMINIDPEAEPVLKKGKVIADPALHDSEQVPLLYEGGIDGFMRNEVLPYAPDAFVDTGKTVIGYELSFTKYFYKPVELRSRETITAEIRELEAQTDGLLNEILED